MQESWRDIPGSDGRYQVSDLGRVRSMRLLTPCPATGTGYLAVTLTGQVRVAVHVLVASAFLGPRPQGMEVNHIDCNRTNNRPDNLEYVTPSENVRHSFRSGNQKLYFSDAQMDRIADMFFVEMRSVTGIAQVMAEEPKSPKEVQTARKRVRSVIEIWRASRRPKGMRNPHENKLTRESAAKIRELHASGGLTQTQIAKMYNVHPAHVSRIIAGKMWALR